jgi:hypothetical protein
LGEVGYEGYIAVEYVWSNWRRMNEIDVLSETILMRDRLRAKLAGAAWSYPTFAERTPGVTDSTSAAGLTGTYEDRTFAAG